MRASGSRSPCSCPAASRLSSTNHDTKPRSDPPSTEPPPTEPRSIMALAPQSTDAFNQLIRLLADVRDDYVLSPERKPDELDAVEGFRYIFHLLSEGTELF